MIVLLDSFQEAEEAHILSTRNAYIPFASGHAGFYHPGVNRGWRDPRAHSGTAQIAGDTVSFFSGPPRTLGHRTRHPVRF